MAARTTIRTPMPIRMRAKQFAMFDALKGLTEAIAEKEHQFCPKKELTEERIKEINQCLTMLLEGDIVSVTYYCQYGRQYQRLTGTLRRVDDYWNEVQVEKTVIGFGEILDIYLHRQ